MSTILLINKDGELHSVNSDAVKLPADRKWDWAADSLSRVLAEWDQSGRACPALSRQFTNKNGFFIITQRDLTDVDRYFLHSEEDITHVEDYLKRCAALSIDEPVAEGQHCRALAFADEHYGKTEPRSIIPGSLYKEEANVVVHELTHAGDRNVDGRIGRHSHSPLFAMVMMLDNFQSGDKGAQAHTEEVYRRAGEDIGEKREREILARMVENVVHSPDGAFHPLVKAYVKKVFFKDMELKAAGREDLCAALLHEMTDFAQNAQHPLHPLYESMIHPGREVDAQRVADAALDFINSIDVRIGADAGNAGRRGRADRPR